MVTDPLYLVDDVVDDVNDEDVPTELSPLESWKAAMAPRTWANGLLEEFFPEGGVVYSARLIVMRYNLMMLQDLRLTNVQEAITAAKNCPPWVETALIQMASSDDDVARNRDAADIGTLIQVVDRALRSPVPMVHY